MDVIQNSTSNDNLKLQMRKGVLEMCVLSAINAEIDIYPSDIKKVLDGSGLDIVEGTLYPLLTRLKNSGYLSYKWVESENGPPRKYYCITDTGKFYLHTLNTEWNEIVQSVSQVLSTTQQN